MIFRRLLMGSIDDAGCGQKGSTQQVEAGITSLILILIRHRRQNKLPLYIECQVRQVYIWNNKTNITDAYVMSYVGDSNASFYPFGLAEQEVVKMWVVLYGLQNKKSSMREHSYCYALS